MFVASDLTASEVREQYLVPLFNEILAKSGLTGYAANIFTQSPATQPLYSTGPTTVIDDIVSSTKYYCDGHGRCERCYAEIIEEASALSGYMTHHEMSLVAAVSTSWFLSFMIPQCDSIGFLRAYFGPTIQSLEKRIDSAITSAYNNASIGVFPYSASRMKSLVEEDDILISTPFYRFLEQGLGSFLASGSAFISSVHENHRMGIKYELSLWAGSDLINILAMAICPHSSRMVYSFDSIDEMTRTRGELITTNSTLPYTFQLSYSDRIRMVRLCGEKISIQESIERCGAYDSSDSRSRNDSPEKIEQSVDTVEKRMFVASIQQLRKSLFEFAVYYAQSEQDSTVAYKALINIVVQEKSMSSIQFEFKRLMDTMLQSTSPYIITAISDCLSYLIARFNGSRDDADDEFTSNSVLLLEEYIHMRIDYAQYDNFVEGKLTICRTSHICEAFYFVALLKVVKTLLHFQFNVFSEMKRKNGSAFDYNEAIDNFFERRDKFHLLHDSLLLLLYPSNKAVVRSAADLVALILTYNKNYLANTSNVKQIFSFTTKSIDLWRLACKNQNESDDIPPETVDNAEAMKSVIYIAARQSETFAYNFLTYFTTDTSQGQPLVIFHPQVFWKVAFLISSVQPLIVSEILADVALDHINADHQSRILEAFTKLSCTMTFKRGQISFDSIRPSLSDDKNSTFSNWTIFRLVRHSFITGNFGVARHMLNELLIPNCSGKMSFLWLSSLAALAAGEDSLRVNGSSAIPDCLKKICFCHSTILSLAVFSTENAVRSSFGNTGRFEFQLQWLKARLDFLRLIVAARFTCSELLLTRSSNETRSSLHLKNLPRCFNVLSKRFLTMYRMFGLHVCLQSRSALRCMISMCRFMTNVLNSVVSQSPSNASFDCATSSFPSGDSNHPMGILLSQLRRQTLTQAYESSNGMLASNVLAAIDSILKCPVPFPFSFFRVKGVPYIFAEVRGHLPTIHSVILHSDEQDILEVPPYIPLQIVVSGIIPDMFFESSNMSFYQILAWRTLSYHGRLVEEEDIDLRQPSDEKSPFISSDHISEGPEAEEPIVTTLLPEGKFSLTIILDPIVVEGFFRVVIRLGCRDEFSGEWLLPTMNLKEIDLLLRVVDK